MARGWNLSTSVVRMYRCGYNNYYSTCISSFLAAASLFICSFTLKNVSLFLLMLFL